MSRRIPWLPAFETLREEHDFRSLRVEGAVPPDLDGTLWSCSPADHTHVPPEKRMWLDGDGAVLAFRVHGGMVEGGVRRVATRASREERAAGRRLHGRYHLRAPLRRHLAELLFGAPRRNPGNTSVWVHRGRVFALSPAGLPHEIDPATLATIGEDRLEIIDGAFSAHASYAANRRAFYDFGTRFGRQSLLDLYVFPDDGGGARVATVPLAAPTFVHDFMVTPRWAVFVIAPARVDPLPLLLGQPLDRALRFRPEEGTEVVLVGLDAPHEIVRFTIDPLVVIHFANAWEEGDDVVLHAPVGRDFMRTWRWLESLAKGTPAARPDPTLHAVRIAPRRKTATFTPLTDVHAETPRISPRVEMRPHRYVYGSGFSDGHGGLPDRIVKTDVARGTTATFDCGPGTYPAEAMFVPRTGATEEDDGWLLSVVYDSAAKDALGDPRRGESCLAILDAREGEVVARAWLGQPITPPFHGTWTGRGAEVPAI